MLGAGILAPNAGEMIGLWTLAIAQRVKLSALASLIVPYPTRAEAGKRAAGNFFVPRLFAPRTKTLGPPAGPVAVSRRSTHFAAMSEASAGPPRVRPRQSLSGRLWLIADARRAAERGRRLPALHRARTLAWLTGRIEDASIAALAAARAAADHGEARRTAASRR